MLTLPSLTCTITYQLVYRKVRKLPYIFPPAVQKAFDAFENRAEIRICGGAVRDLLLGKTPKDWDMCTTALPADVLTIVEKVGLRPYDLSNGHGTISFTFEGDTVEITTLRVDEKTDGRHAEVRFVDDFKLDAARRDFTFNAMSMSSNGWVHDYFGGIEDLQNGRIRFVGDADERMKEDYLRILRYFRFLGRYGVDSRSAYDAAAIKRNLEGLKQISGERIWMEMQQIFAGPNNQKVVEVMNGLGVFGVLGIKVRNES